MLSATPLLMVASQGRELPQIFDAACRRHGADACCLICPDSLLWRLRRALDHSPDASLRRASRVRGLPLESQKPDERESKA